MMATERWQLDLPRERFLEIGEPLFPHWQQYVKEVSAPGMAMSPQTAVYLMYMCEVTRPKAVCDLGSGFSSFVLRTYAKTSGCEVVSVDDDADWSVKSVEYLHSKGLDGEVVVWDEFRKDLTPRFDLVFHDLAQGDVRNEGMPVAAAICRSGGFVLFDDAHHASHAQAMTETCKQFDMMSWSLRHWTYDNIGRFAALARKP